MKTRPAESSEFIVLRLHRRKSPPWSKPTFFKCCWIYLGHDSEIPKVGDFRRRTVAGQPLFWVRGSDGRARVFYNSCTHWGANVCRLDDGNAELFQCFYHAWTFNNQGELVSVPDEAAYGEGFQQEEQWVWRRRRESITIAGFILSASIPTLKISLLSGRREGLYRSYPRSG